MTTFHIPDMTCSHCVATLTRALKALDPQATLQFDLAGHRLTVDSPSADSATVVAAIEEAGFTPAVVQGMPTAPTDARGAGCAGGAGGGCGCR